jgi:RNA polymerase sigma-70 factor (ECF subfamily)
MPELERSVERDLMERFRDGDREAFTALYRAHSPAVFRFALHMTGDRAKAAEATQEVFVWLIEHVGGFDPVRGELGAYLAGVVRKIVRRQQQREQRWMPLYEGSASPVNGKGRSSGAPYDDEVAGLRKAIASLPARYREAVVLCDLEGRSYEEAAEVAGCATGTVRSRLHRARGLLARKLVRSKEWQRCAS